MNRSPRRSPRYNPRPHTGPALPDSHNDCMLRARPLSLVSPDGVIPLEKIGKGMFATVYRETTGKHRVFSVVDEGIYDKEIAAMVHEGDPRNPHLPRVERFGMLTDNRTVFTMPFYAVPFRMANANPASRAAFAALRKCIVGIAPHRNERGHEVAARKLECIEGAGAKIPPNLVGAVQALYSMSMNYSDRYDFELSPRNVATDDQGNLVLLDVLFDRDRARERDPRRRHKVRLTLGMGLGMRLW